MVSGSPAGLRLINPLFYRLNLVCKRTDVHCRQYRPIASIAAAEKRPLKYQVPQSVLRARNCGIRTWPLTIRWKIEGGEG